MFTWAPRIDPSLQLSPPYRHSISISLMSSWLIPMDNLYTRNRIFKCFLQLTGGPKPLGQDPTLSWPFDQIQTFDESQFFKIISSKEDLKLFRTVVFNPAHISNLFNSILWSAVSNAALRSNKTNTKAFPASCEVTSFGTVMRVMRLDTWLESV